MTRQLPATQLHRMLSDWEHEGLIDPAQAARIEAAETARQPVSRSPLVIEAVGYLGGTLAVVGGVIAVGQLWPQVPVWGRLALAAGAATVLLVTGGLIRAGANRGLDRLHSALWLLSTAAFSAFVALLGVDVWHLEPKDVTVLAAGVTLGYAALLWWRTPMPVQQVAVFAALAVTTGSGVDRLLPGMQDWAPGVAVWLVALAWGVLAFLGLLRPALIGYLAAGVGLLVAAQLTMPVAAGNALGLLTVAGLLAAGVALRQVPLLVLGAIGVIMVVPETVSRYLPAEVGAPLSIFVVGVVLLGAALWLARRHGLGSGRPPRRSTGFPATRSR